MTPGEADQAIEVLQRQMMALRTQVHALAELVDVLATPPWKRVWFWLCGWKLYEVGRWRGMERSAHDG